MFPTTEIPTTTPTGPLGPYVVKAIEEYGFESLYSAACHYDDPDTKFFWVYFLAPDMEPIDPTTLTTEQ